MNFFFANPVGFLALLGIPVLLLIHLLQRQSRQRTISTLFLLDHIDRQNLHGKKVQRLRQSIPLWLQILCVLILTWLLSEPRWARTQSLRQIAWIIDSSASMKAFQDQLPEVVSTITGEGAGTGLLELTVLESHPGARSLYRGNSPEEMLQALSEWSPSDSAHSPESALRTGRSLVGANGTLVYVTDHLADALPYGAQLVSIGQPLEQAGFTGAKVDQREGETVWTVTVKNYGQHPVTRQWFLASNQQRSPSQTIQLEPGEVRQLSGPFPTGVDRVSLHLEPDAYAEDDQMFLIAPQSKQLRVKNLSAATLAPILSKIMDSLEQVELVGPDEEADFTFASYDPLSPSAVSGNALVFLHQEAVPNAYLSGLITAANHPLVNQLSWHALLARNLPSIPPVAGDKTLVWQNDRPLVFLREANGDKQLVFNFDLLHSNASRLPALVLLVHRYINEVRNEQVAYEAKQVDLNQLLGIVPARLDDSPPLQLTDHNGTQLIPLTQASAMRAPASPGFFQVRQGETLLLDGASNFADTREADFSAASTNEGSAMISEAINRQHTSADPWWQIWLLGLVGILLFCWHWLSQKTGSRVLTAETGSP